MFNKKRIVIFVGFLCCLFFMTTFAGAPAQNTIIATRTVEFVDGYNNRTISEQTIEVGTDAVVPSDPEHDGYIFAGWYLFDNQEERVTDFTSVLNDLKVIAKYQGDANRNGIADEEEPHYIVTFIDSYDGSIIGTDEVLVGLAATAPQVPTHEGLTFIGWSGSYSNVTENVTVRTVYTNNNTETPNEAPIEEINYYNVVFIDTLTNRVITSERVQEGLTASTPTTPEHEGYLFIRWNGDFTNVTSNREIYTVYAKDENNNGVDDATETKYKITFNAGENGQIINEDGTLQNEYTIANILSGTEFGQIITKLPELKANENYIENGWNETIPASSFAIKEDLTFTAKYLNDINNNGIPDENETLLVVTFIDTISNKTLKVEEVLPNMSASAPTPLKYDQKLFKGWDKEFTNITEDTIINTIYVDDLNNNGVDDTEEQDTKKTLTIEYVSINPTTQEYNELIPSKTLELLPGQPYSINSERIEWYTLSLENINEDTMTLDGIMLDEDTTIRFIYTPGQDKNNNGIDDRNEVGNEKTLTVLYESYNQKEDKYNTLKENITLSLLPGEPYEISAPTIENYTISEEDGTITGIMGETDKTEKFIYAPIGDDKNNDGIPDTTQTKSTLTINYISYNNESGKEHLLDTLVVENVVENLEYTVKAKIFDGYTFSATKTGNLTFNMPANDYTFTVYYLVDGKDENKDGENDKFEDLYTLKIEYISVKEDGSFGETLGTEVVRTNFVKDEAYDITELVNNKTELLKENYDLYNNPTLTGTIPTIIEGEKTLIITISYRPKQDENNNGILDEKEPDKYTLKINYISVYNDEFGNEQIGENFGIDTDTKTYVINSNYDVKTLVDAKIETLKDKYEIIDRTEEKGKITESTDLTNIVTIKFRPLKDENNNGINDDDEKHYTLNVKYVIVNRKGEVVNDNYGSAYVGSYVSGSEYKVTAPNFIDYELVNTEDTKGIMPTNDITVILQYRVADPQKDLDDNGILDEKETKYTLTVKYISKGTNSNYTIDTKPYSFVGNANYTITVPESIDGKYILLGNSTITGSMPTENTTIEVLYKVVDGKDINGNGEHDDDETPVELVINLVRKENTKTIILETITENYLVGQEYKVLLPTTLENGKYELSNKTNELTGSMPSTKTIVEVIYTAKNDENKDGIADEDQRRVQYVDYDGTILYNNLITLGENTPVITEPTREYHIFSGWNPTVNKTVTEDITYTATYKEDKNNDNIPDEEQNTYTVTFYGFNNEILSTQEVLVKMSATEPIIPTIDGYTFKGWDKEFTNIHSNLEVYASYVDETAPIINANFKLYNEDQKAEIGVSITELGSGIKEVKYIKGNVSLEEARNGLLMNQNDTRFVKDNITENGYYTIYAIDNAGNETIQTLIIEGILVLSGDFEDKYAEGTFGSLKGLYYRDLNIKTKSNVKIVDAQVYKAYSYATIEDFETKNKGTKIDFTDTSLNYRVNGSWLQCVTIYVKYEYQEEIAPGVFETKYISKLYRTRLSYIWGQTI